MAAVAPVFPAGTYRHYRWTTTVSTINDVGERFFTWRGAESEAVAATTTQWPMASCSVSRPTSWAMVDRFWPTPTYLRVKGQIYKRVMLREELVWEGQRRQLKGVVLDVVSRAFDKTVPGIDLRIFDTSYQRHRNISCR